MKMSDLRRKTNENASMGAVSGGAIGTSAGGLGDVAATVKAQKKRKLRDGQVVGEVAASLK
jgi:hypothetical protein